MLFAIAERPSRKTNSVRCFLDFDCEKSQQLFQETDTSYCAWTNRRAWTVNTMKTITKPCCGLCGKAEKISKTSCCGQWICNDEENYKLFSYARNSCSRNHRRMTLCGFHSGEKHDASWQDCKQCRDMFPTEMYVWYGTNEYNFEKLKNPPHFEPTLCDGCGVRIHLGTEGYTQGPEGMFCERCTGRDRFERPEFKPATRAPLDFIPDITTNPHSSMHTISNETALAHWKALNQVSASTLKLMIGRFLNTQPYLATALLPLKGNITIKPNNTISFPEFNDPKTAHFWRAASAAAVINEIMIREAGRPLRKLGTDEVDEILNATCDVIEKARGEREYSLKNLAGVFKASPQLHLLTGAIFALTNEAGRKNETLSQEILELNVLVEALHRACGDAPATSPRSWDVERVEFALSTQGDPLRREALAACDMFRDELVKDFLYELNGWATDPKAALKTDGVLGMHALFILARWREESAWPVFRKLFSLPGDIGYSLLGDFITEDGSIALAMLVGKHREELRAMVEDEGLDDYCRNACLDALTCLVAWGELPREEHVAYLRELLTARLRGVPENEHTFGGVVSATCDMEAWELSPEVEAAYERGVVDEGFVSLRFFLECKAGKHRSQWQAFCDSHKPITDVAAATSWLDVPLSESEPPSPSEDEDYNVIADSDQPYIAPPKVGRNDPCTCGSGKKFKKCCGK